MKYRYKFIFLEINQAHKGLKTSVGARGCWKVHVSKTWFHNEVPTWLSRGSFNYRTPRLYNHWTMEWCNTGYSINGLWTAWHHKSCTHGHMITDSVAARVTDLLSLVTHLNTVFFQWCVLLLLIVVTSLRTSQIIPWVLFYIHFASINQLPLIRLYTKNILQS